GTRLLTRRLSQYVTRVCAAAGQPPPVLLQGYGAAAELDDTAGDEDPPVGGHFEPEAAGSGHLVTLRDRDPLGQLRARREQPSAEVGTRRSGARVFDDGAVLGKEETGHDVSRVR